jgi:hypothetical protein
MSYGLCMSFGGLIPLELESFGYNRYTWAYSKNNRQVL